MIFKYLSNIINSPESLSVNVNTNEDASLIAVPVRLGPTLIHPSGWQKYTISSGSGKSL